ncbi:hypothetical protein [uncultured Dubosiella sp.]|uniref:hypothetical protein n=1 Tax=uncultured Dubosiella sp. TaxID=1937011 RepID=UPI0025B42A71|nr:hypothetical protein [uncultured Dubosiella sp.]
MLATLQRKSDISKPDIPKFGKAWKLTYPIRVNTPSVDQMYKKEELFMSMIVKEIDEKDMKMFKLHKEIVDKYFK